MKVWILNFLATRAGAALAPLVLTFLTSVVAWVASRVPWLAPHVTMESSLALVGLVLAVLMSLVNYLTTARAFKYAGPVQKFLDTIGQKLGLQPLKLDSVIAGHTASTAIQIETILTRPGGAFNPHADVRRAAARLPSQRLPRPGNEGGYVVGYLIIGMSLAAVCLLLACAARQEARAKAKHGHIASQHLSLYALSPVFPDITETLPLNYAGPWLQFSPSHTLEYARPAWQRSFLSLRPWGETGAALSKVRVDEHAVTLSGGWKDDESLSARKILPQSYALGIGGGVEF